MDEFATFIQKQRDELQKKRNALTQDMVRIQDDIAAIDREMAAIHAYEQAKLGKTATPATKRGRRGNVRDTVLDAIKSSGGINRADLLVKLGAKGDKAAEQSISNALANLKKAGTVSAADGVYTVAG